MTENEIQPIIRPGSPATTGPTTTVSVERVLAYQERMEEVNKRQRDSLTRLLEKIKELEERNRKDASEIAQLTGAVVAAEQRIAEVQVQLDRAIEERNEAVAAVAAVKSLMDQAKDLTVDGEPVTATTAKVVWERHYDTEPAHDEAEVALDASESTPPPIVPGAMPIGEERPASGFGTSDDDRPGRHASLT